MIYYAFVTVYPANIFPDRPLTDLYDTEGDGGYPGFAFTARPVVGGHFAFLALERACGGNAVQALDFLNEPSNNVARALPPGVFAIKGSVSKSPLSVSLLVLNGLVGDPPMCYGTVASSSGDIPCEEGYSLSYDWSETTGLAAIYSTPIAPAFTYSIPIEGCKIDGNVCEYGFENYFPHETDQNNTPGIIDFENYFPRENDQALVSGIFAFYAIATVDPISVNLVVLNGLVGDPPRCSGTVSERSGNIPCDEGYSVFIAWSRTQFIATYSTPTAPAFTYNIPFKLTRNHGNILEFVMENYHPQEDEPDMKPELRLSLLNMDL